MGAIQPDRSQKGSSAHASPKRRVSGFGSSHLRPNPAVRWTSGTLGTFGEIVTFDEPYKEQR